MTTDNNAEEIEIPEEAYKQNTVYRPWSDIQAGIRVATAYTPPAQRQRLKDEHRPLQR